MSHFRQRIEQRFEKLALLLYRRRLAALICIAVMAGLLIAGLPRLELDTSTEGMLHTDDPIIDIYDDFREQFGRDAVIVIALEPDRIYDPGFLDFLRDLHQDLARGVPYLEDITSLINARHTRGEGDVLTVGELMADWPRSEADLAVLKERIEANPLYINQLVTPDHRLTTLALKLQIYAPDGGEGADGASDDLAGFEEDEPAADGQTPVKAPEYLTNDQQIEAVEAVEAILDRYRDRGVEIHLAGPPVVGTMLEKTMIGDLYTSVIAVLVMVTICLAVMFRRPSGVLLPQLIVNLSMTSTLGLMAWLKVPVKLPSMVLPAFLLAVAVGASVHVLALFYRRLARDGDRRGAIVHALGRSGLAIVMTSLTTAAGLASFATASVAPIADMGIFSAVGVMIALVYTIVLLPALLALVPIKPGSRKSLSNRLDTVLAWVAAFSVRRAKAITLISLAIIAVSGAGAAQLRFSHNVLEWLPTDLPVRRATELIDGRLNGTVNVEVVIDTGRENGLHDPKVLQALDRLARRLEAETTGGVRVGKSYSVADVLKEIHQALNENRPEFHRVPDDGALIPQEFLLFENSGSDDLEEVVDSSFRMARFTARVPWGDAIIYAPFLERLRTMFAAELGPEVDITVTGIMTLFFRTINASIISMARSYAIALVVVTLMMIALIGEVRIGLLAMLPNLAPILLTLGLMGWLGLPLDMITMLTGSIAIGLAVDDTVHFMHHFRRNYLQTGDAALSVHNSLALAGRAMMVTTIVLSLGFFVLMTATLGSVNRFGFLTGVTVILALVADFFLAPALMVLAYGRRDKNRKI